MQFVPSLPPPITPGGREEGGETKQLTAVKKVEDVLARPVSTPTIKQQARQESPSDVGEIAEKRQAAGGQAERRTFCRRIVRQPILVELRSAADRRRKRQRKDDVTDHVDEEA